LSLESSRREVSVPHPFRVIKAAGKHEREKQECA
jgi:hypothetical protein